MKKRNRNLIIAGAALLLLLGFGIQQGLVPNPFAAWAGGGGGIIPSNTEYVKASGKVQYENGTAVVSATVLLQYTNLEGQLVTLTQTGDSSDGTFTTGNAYVPEGVDVNVMVSKTGFHTQVFTARVPVGDWSNRETAYLGEFTIYYAATTAATTDAAIDQDGSDISSSYNFTTSGTALTFKYTMSLGTAGHKAGNEPYTDLSTGYSYSGPMIVIKSTSNLVIPDGYDDIVQVGTTFYYIYNVDPFWNDPDTVGDGSVTYTYSLDIQLSSTTADCLSIYFYQSVRTDYINNANFGTALESIVDIDLQA